MAQPRHTDLARPQQLIDEQDGVVCRRQVLECGGDDNVIECRLRSREWASVHRGVYVDHTGPPSWRQLAWAAVLYHWPVALCHVSALRVHGLGRVADSPDEPIHVAVDATRRPRPRAGIRAYRVARLHERLQPSRTPPRVRLEEAVLDVAADTDDEATAVAVLADACQYRRTTAGRLRRTLATRPKLRRRRFLLPLLTDVETGTYSVLEHRYLTRVERPHGLPTGRRQRVSRTVSSRPIAGTISTATSRAWSTATSRSGPVGVRHCNPVVLRPPWLGSS